jgi:hypothetical protein
MTPTRPQLQSVFLSDVIDRVTLAGQQAASLRRTLARFPDASLYDALRHSPGCGAGTMAKLYAAAGAPKVHDAAAERAAVVAWLRSKVTELDRTLRDQVDFCSSENPFRVRLSGEVTAYHEAARVIERGDHLKGGAQ